jgi:hypothetical protein
VVLSWTNPTSAFDEIRVVRKADVDPDGPTDGTVVYSGTGTGVTDGGLAADTVYHYAVWTVAGGVFSADAVRATATPQP